MKFLFLRKEEEGTHFQSCSAQVTPDYLSLLLGQVLQMKESGPVQLLH
jgi:hypothetical protein